MTHPEPIPEDERSTGPAHGAEPVSPRSIEQELEEILRDAESAITELRAELAAQQARGRQHEEVERLPEHLATTRVRWREVRAFFDEVIAELRGHRDGRGQ